MDINRWLSHFSEVSIFGPSALALFLVLGLDLALTLVHTVQEWRGSAVPLWRNFGAIVGVCVPDWLGFPLFFLFLTAALWLVGLVGITGSLPTGPVRPQCAAAALGALVGARFTDTLTSHVVLYALRYRPNPGLASTPFYVAEAAFIIAAFSKGLAADGSLIGLGVGAGFFCVILPLIWGLRFVVPSWRRNPWHRGQPLPQWAFARC
jgi:hypothetical protein